MASDSEVSGVSWYVYWINAPQGMMASFFIRYYK